MAKGNIFMGTLKGRVGDSVFYVKNGEQNVVKKQTHVSNPQSNKQMYQRSRFLACSKFFTRGNKNYFKFAFENKRRGESDFNAFMRENIVNSPNITRDAYQFTNYPIIGDFIMTRGSLPSIEQSAVNNAWRATFPVKYTGEIAPTISSLSRALISTGVYQIGDIITLLFITTGTSAGVPSLHPQLYPSSYGTPVWTIKQFKINPSDYTELSELGLHFAQAADGSISLIGDEGTDFFPEDQYSGFCCVHSRITKHGLKVSTSKLDINRLAAMANEDQQDDTIIAEVIADWKNPSSVPVTNDIILEGSLVSSSTNVEGVTVESNPTGAFNLFGTNFISKGMISEGSSGIVGYIVGDGIGAARYSAILEEGDSDSTIQFDQIDENRVSIAYEAHGDNGTVNTYTIGMLIGGQPIPIAKVTWTIGQSAVLTATPWVGNGNPQVFVFDQELPHGDILFSPAFTEEESTPIYVNTLFENSTYRFKWAETSQRWISYEGTAAFMVLTQTGDREYTLSHNSNRLFMLPFKVEYNGQDNWINPDRIDRIIAEKVGQGEYSIDDMDLSIPVTEVINSGVCARVKLCNGDAVNNDTNVTVEGDTVSGFTVTAYWSEANQCVEVMISHQSGKAGDFTVKQSGKAILNVYAEEEP